MFVSLSHSKMFLTHNMSSIYQTLFLAILVFCLGYTYCDVFPTFGDKTHVGSWRPVKNLTDIKVVEIGVFAVGEHNIRDKTKLLFQKLIKGETLQGYATKYNLTISAKDGVRDNIAKNYVALVVEEQIMKILHLVSFKGPI
ncbi:putative Cystatin domain-containing protein [Helianthus annuus]|uniref:Cystatin domain-containing protein n=3 Tax=Helianthus annuus TaxID=4232 RepID=A0A9K3DG54_HELAN|nr:putative Cystatin domain-containing protein [Helianthus annuus]KAJ0428667.1 putative Cystatin domain-containing protein [Helianthus annuus]KAJ0432815.1 putative Cystatin domain-containing protein [Helianthus annuus]KAJ0447002.1 putative Cystatin domain-containing protein [Helianthus annuus]KAJ0631902.1 putative Cystatin domain-containing protein [Helianthus annuus]